MKKTPLTYWYLRLGWLSISLALLVWLLSYLWGFRGANLGLAQVGPLGDWVGGLTAPFINVAGFFMLFAAFRQQSNDMEEGRREFLTQRFESTFFHLLNLHHQNVSAIRLQYTRKSQEDFFEATHHYLVRQTTAEPDTDLFELYQRYYQRNYNLIDHFVRHLLFTLQRIDLSQAFRNLPEADARDEKQHYVDILSAQLSADELFLMFYQVLCDPGQGLQAFVPLLDRYYFFAKMQSQGLLLSPHHWQLYQSLCQSHALPSSQ